MNNCCICWFFTHILLGILIFKGLTAQRLYKSFGGKRLTALFQLHAFSMGSLLLLLSANVYEGFDLNVLKIVFRSQWKDRKIKCVRKVAVHL
jgi:hypothetical protein